MDAAEALQAYLSDCRNIPLATEPQQHQWLARAQSGDADAFTALTRSLLASTADIALAMRPINLDPLEAVLRAHRGLAHLIEDPAVNPPLEEHLEALVARIFNPEGDAPGAPDGEDRN